MVVWLLHVLFVWLAVLIKADPFAIEVRRKTAVDETNDNQVIVMYKKIFVRLALSKGFFELSFVGSCQCIVVFLSFNYNDSMF